MEALNILTITQKAKNKISEIMTQENPLPEYGLRLSVKGGGCSGLSYAIEFGPQKERDTILQLDSVKILIDPKSLLYLKGSVLDFKDGLQGKGLVFDNPNAKNTCGCGESFSF